MPAKIPVTNGDRFGCLEVIREDGKKYGKPVYLCKCDCGLVSHHLRTHLRYDRVACGNRCAVRPPSNYRHGAAVGPGRDFKGSYRSWLAMRQRCLDPNNKSYKNYGQRGITICERWNQFSNFLEDMGERPDGYTIERREVNGNYEPGNCYWSPAADQTANTRRCLANRRT